MGSLGPEWIRSEWGLSEANRRARWYHITDLGREQLVQQTTGWERLVRAATLVLHGATA